MGIFNSIRTAIFGRREQAQTAAAAPAPEPVGAATAITETVAAATNAAAAAAASAAPQQPVDVEEVLTEIAAEKGNPALNWRTSIVDLMKLLDLDSSLDNRKALATELGYTGAKDGSAEMNIWLHRKVLEQLEAHGGHVPASMKD